MPSIKPVSDLRSYTDVLADVNEGSPVFLTKNGRGKYAILDIRDYDSLMAAGALAGELARGRREGDEKGWMSEGDVRAHFARRAAEDLSALEA